MRRSIERKREREGEQKEKSREEGLKDGPRDEEREGEQSDGFPAVEVVPAVPFHSRFLPFFLL